MKEIYRFMAEYCLGPCDIEIHIYVIGCDVHVRTDIDPSTNKSYIKDVIAVEEDIKLRLNEFYVKVDLYKKAGFNITMEL